MTRVARPSDGSAKVKRGGEKKQAAPKNSRSASCFGKAEGVALPLADSQAIDFQTFSRLLPMDKKEQIQELISQGKTEEALELLEQLTSDAVLLQSRYNGVKKQYGMGLIDFNEWSRTQAQISYAALEMMKGVKGDGGGQVNIVQPANGTSNVSTSAAIPNIYITYAPEVEEDKNAALRIRDFLVNNAVSVTTNDDIILGADIQDFVNDSIKKANFIIAVISKQSLQSSWESGEAALDIVLERVSENKVLPVSLDKSVLEPDFYFESLDLLNELIKKYQGLMQRAIEKGGDSRGFQAELNRLQNSKNQLAQIIEKMKSVRMVNLGKGKASEQDFVDGMTKILNRIKNAKA